MDQRTIVNYDELHKIAKLFEQEGEAIARREAMLRQRANQLESEWIGEGADKFFNEFFQEVLPGMTRLQEACIMTSQTLVMVMKIFNEAEEETAGYFKDGSLEGSGEGGTTHGIDVGGLEFDVAGIDPGEVPGGMPTSSGIDVEDLEFKVETGAKFFNPGEGGLPPTGEGEGDFGKIETGQKPVPATQEAEFAKQETDFAKQETATGGGGGGGSTGDSSGIQGGLEMGVGSSSQVSGGPGVGEAGGVGGSQSAPQHVYQDPAGAGVGGASPQSATSASAGTTGGPTPVSQSGIGEAAGAAGALGGAGAAAAAAAKKIKENKDGE